MSKKKYEIIIVDDVEIVVDISNFEKNEETSYVLVTDIATKHGKKARDWLALSDTKRFITALIKKHPEISNVDNSTLWKVQKGHYGGTFLHKKLMIPFLQWCSPEFYVECNDALEDLFKSLHLRKEKRLEAKTGFKPMTDAIQQAHKTPKGYHYSNECNMLTKIIKGKNAKQLRLEHNVEDVRSLFNANEMEALSELQEINTALLKIGMEYEVRKEALNKHHRSKYQTVLIA